MSCRCIKTIKTRNSAILYAVLHKGTEPDILIIFTHAGLNNKSGVGGWFVEIADRLAESGFNVLRFDPYGCGDSQGKIDFFSTNQHFFLAVQSGYFISTLRDVVTWAGTEGFKNIFLLGHCGGAVTNFLALADLEIPISGLILIALPVLYSHIPVIQASRFRIKFFSNLSRRYRIILANSFRLKFPIIWVRWYLKKIFNLLYPDIKLPRSSRFNTHLFEAFVIALKKGTPMLFLLPELDDETADFNSEFHLKVLPDLLKKSNLIQIRSIPGADHSMMFPDSRAELYQITVQWIKNILKESGYASDR